MNNERRKRIEAIEKRARDASDLIAGLIDELEEIGDEETEYQDAIPESMTEKREASEELSGYIEEGRDTLENANSEIDTAIGSLEQARG